MVMVRIEWLRQLKRRRRRRRRHGDGPRVIHLDDYRRIRRPSPRGAA